jgi:pyruvate-ferredoxin/flavodoxin oxidoreductase
VREVTGPMLMGEGDSLPVSALPADGTFPTGTSRWEKRALALEIPVWDESLCIQCGKCVLVCPHAAIRAKAYPPERLADAPDAFKSAPAMWKDLPGLRYTLQVAPEDCTGCTLCTSICPVTSKVEATHKALDMVPISPIRERERSSWTFFEQLVEVDARGVSGGHVKRVQLLQPLFEFSGACAGCGETPYIKLLTQLFGDRAVIANATGCSSIFGGNLPTTPYTTDRQGRGPAWSNSLFEDNAEFGLGMRLAIDQQANHARSLVRRLAAAIGEPLATELVETRVATGKAMDAQRARVSELRARLAALPDPAARELTALADALIPKSVWIVGGDGWAYDIGFGGVDHVLASGENVKLLVLDSEVYSNTGGQRSKATPRGAVARFAAGGKTSAKKDLALMAMSYRDVYVARVAMGGGDTQTVQAFEEAEAFDGPSLIIAFSPCIAHGYDLSRALEHQRLAVQSGYWPLFRYNPARIRDGRHPLTLDSRPPTAPLSSYLATENRFDRVVHAENGAQTTLLHAAEADAARRWQLYEQLAALPVLREPQEGVAADRRPDTP